MKKLISSVLILVMLLTTVICKAEKELENPLLDKAITSLWIDGPDARIENQLKMALTSPDEKIVSKSLFHLSCLQLMKGEKEKAIELLSRLKGLERTEESRSFISRLENIIQSQPLKEEALTNNKVNLDLKEVEIGIVLNLIAKTADINIVKHKDVKGKISIRLKDATVMDSLEVICKMSDLAFEKNGNIYLVYPQGMKNFNKNYVKEEIQLGFLSADAGKKILSSNQESFPDLIARPFNNNLLLEGTPESIEKAKQLIFSRDKEGKAHTISIKIWEFKDKKLQLESFSKLEEKEKQNVAKLLSAPKLSTLPGQRAQIKVGHNSEDKSKKSEDIFSYETDLVFNEAEQTNHVILEMSNKIFGKTYDKDEKKEIKRSFSTTVKIQKNKWLAFPIDESKKLFMEVNVKAN